jgi:hypothetical protein
MTEDEKKRQKMEILYRHDEAIKSLDGLLLTLRQVRQKLGRVVKLLTELESSEFGLHGPATALLELPKPEYAAVCDFLAIQALAESILRAQRELSEAEEDKRRL